MKNEITLKKVYESLVQLKGEVSVIQKTKIDTLQIIRRDMAIIIIISAITLILHLFFIFLA